MNPTICLNLLLIGDSPSIISVLEFAKEHIDYWVIAEHGCSEETLNNIESLYSDVPGELVSVVDSNQADGLNSLLAFSRDKADYLLMLDDHTVFNVGDKDFKQQLQKDAYFVRSEARVQRSELRFIKGQLGCHYVGAVRPYIVTDAGASTELLFGVTVRSIAQKDRYDNDEAHDADVFEEALRLNENNAHALFQLATIRLAQSEHQEASDLFSKYLQQPSLIDDEWEWYAHYCLARLTEHFEDETQAVINAYLLAHQLRPSRAESLFELARFYRQKENYKLAHIYSSQAFLTPMPVLDTFDIDTRLYEWTIPAEHAMICQQLDRHGDVVDASNRALINGKVPINMRDSLISFRQRSNDILQGAKAAHDDKHQNRIRLLIPFRNAAAYIERCIESIQNQDYGNFTATFIDDCSTDNSAALIPTDDSRFELIRNSERIGAFLNRMNFILKCGTEDIVLYLDGDDQLSSDNALSYVNELYQDYDCWLSYGQYISQTGHTGHALPYSSQEKLVLALENGEMRFPIHPITHRAGLFHRIKDFDPDYKCFKDDDGEWLFYASDAVLVRPLFYLAGFAKIHYCNRALYLYTEGHESSVNVSNKQEQIETCRTITTRPRLPPVANYS